MDFPDNGSVTPGSNDGNATSTTATANEGANDFRKQLEQERAARLKAEKAYEEQRRFNGRLTNDLGELRRRVQPESSGDGYSPQYEEEAPPRRSDGRFKRQRDEGEAFQSALDGFQLDLLRTAKKFPNGEWEPYYEKAVEYIKDPANAEMIAVFNPDGNVDFRKTLRSALREIRLSELDAAQAQSQTKRTEVNRNNEASKAQATISGEGASSHDEMLDVTQMSMADLRKHIAIDKGDPPSYAQTNMRNMLIKK